MRRLAEGQRAAVVRFGRFFANRAVTVERLLAGWGVQTAGAATGRHVLAIQDTSEITFRTTAGHRRGLGKIGKGGGYGVLLHAMLAVDAASGGCLGLVAGRVWRRGGRARVPHARRPLAEKESERWLSTAEQAQAVLAAARMVTVVADRESDIYAEWARLPGPRFHLLTRVMHDRRITGGLLYEAWERLSPGGTATLELRERADRPARTARLTLRFGEVELRRPGHGVERGLPKSVAARLVEVRETDAPAGAEPLHWRLLTTHRVDDAAAAWQIVDWYRARWTIEQLFRTLKRQGLRLEDSQLDSAERLLKLTAIAAHAACLVLQLVHARDGRSGEPASRAFTPPEIAAMDILLPRLEGATAAQKNPHPHCTLAWAAWIIAKLGGWDGYPRSKPPGPITFRNGLQYFEAFTDGCTAANVCIP